MAPEFFQTQMGQKHYQKTMPTIASQLEQLNTNLVTLTELIREGLIFDQDLRKQKEQREQQNGVKPIN